MSEHTRARWLMPLISNSLFAICRSSRPDGRLGSIALLDMIVKSGRGAQAPAASLTPVQAPSTPLSSRGRATRQRLLTAARDVFEERGFPDTRITHITDGRRRRVRQLLHPLHLEGSDLPGGRLGPVRGDVRAGRRAPRRHPASSASSTRTEVYAERYRRNARLMGIVEQVATIDDDFRGLRQQHRRTTTDRTSASIRRWQEQGTVRARARCPDRRARTRRDARPDALPAVRPG